MFETILVATDLSAASDALIDGLGMARTLGAESAVLCHALGIQGHESLSTMLARIVEPRLKQQQERLEKIGFTVSIEMPPGVPALEIHRVAGERQGRAPGGSPVDSSRRIRGVLRRSGNRAAFSPLRASISPVWVRMT